MKKTLLLILAVCSLALAGCKKAEDTPNYYIQYHIYSIYGHAMSLNATYTDETGNPKHVTSNNHSFNFEYVVGPVPYGFKASLNGVGGLRISVCRGSEPWMIKAEGTGSISYTIDF